MNESRNNDDMRRVDHSAVIPKIMCIPSNEEESKVMTTNCSPPFRKQNGSHVFSSPEPKAHGKLIHVV